MRRYQASDKKIRIGIVGCGAIGSLLAKACVERFAKQVKIAALHDINKRSAGRLKSILRLDAAVSSLDELIRKSDLVIEAASAGVSLKVASKAIKAGKDVMIMSTGGLLSGYKNIFTKAKRTGSRVYIPSGAVCGLDAAKAAAMGKIKSVALVTRKPPKGLEGAPYIALKRINLKNIKKETLIFEGSAAEAVKAFPANINVSAVLSLAALGPQKTRVKIYASPGSNRNIHEVFLEGDCGKIHTKSENVPSKANPKTSMLAVLSAIATLKSIIEPVKIGT